MAGAATPAIAALVKAGAAHQVVKFDSDFRDSRHHSFSDEAVHALTQGGDIAPEQIFKTLIIAVPDGLAVAILPAPARLSLKAAAAALGVAKASMAEPSAAELATGYVVGAISPFGQRKQMRTVLDSAALAWEWVFCSAGRRGWDVAVSPQNLIRVTGAMIAAITT